MLDDKTKYAADSIKLLKAGDAVRGRPSMDVGNIHDGSALHQMIYEVVDNAMEEAFIGYVDLLTVTLNADGSCTITDNGRAIPTDIDAGQGVSKAEIIMTQMHAGRRPDHNIQTDGFDESAGRWRGLNFNVINALSAYLKLSIKSAGKIHEMTFTNGVADAPLAVVGDAGDETGITIRFFPSIQVFTKVDFDFDRLERHLRELALLNCGVHILLEDHRNVDPRTEEFYFPKSKI